MIICRQKTKISKKHKAFIGLCAEANLCLNLRNKIEMLNLLVLNISWDIYFDMNYTLASVRLWKSKDGGS